MRHFLFWHVGIIHRKSHCGWNGWIKSKNWDSDKGHHLCHSLLTVPLFRKCNVKLVEEHPSENRKVILIFITSLPWVYVILNILNGKVICVDLKILLQYNNFLNKKIVLFWLNELQANLVAVVLEQCIYWKNHHQISNKCSNPDF